MDGLASGWFGGCCCCFWCLISSSASPSSVPLAVELLLYMDAKKLFIPEDCCCN